jgi:hypothetical protein
MYGELRDANSPDPTSIYENCRRDACVIMFTALSAMGWYYTRRCRALFYDQALAINASSTAPHAAQERSAALEHAAADAHISPAAAHSAAVELLPVDAVGEGAAAERHELLPRPFLRAMFPTWRDYEHVHVSALHVAVPPRSGWGKCGGRFPVGSRRGSECNARASASSSAGVPVAG